MSFRLAPLFRFSRLLIAPKGGVRAVPVPFFRYSKFDAAPRKLEGKTSYAQRSYSDTRAVTRGTLQSSSAALWTAGIVFGIAVGAALLIPRGAREHPTAHKSDTQVFSIADLTDSYLVMALNTPPGRPGTLTPEEERKLRELWAVTLRVFGVETAVEETNGVENTPPATAAATPATPAAPTEPSEKEKKEKKKSRLSVFKRHKDTKSEADTPSTTAPSTPTRTSTSTAPPDISTLSISADDDKFGQTAAFKAALANTSPEDLRRAFWAMVKHDHPDALLLRFLRARKWDVEKALIMMISTMHWRLTEMHVDEDIMLRGEAGAVADAQSEDAKTKKGGEDFLTMLRVGKSFLHGVDKEGRPMCFVRARLHRAGEQSEESLERFTVYTIETARMLLRPPVDTATIIFDMTSFSLSNMDYAPVRFMIKCFEANYPESLGAVLVFRAPWVFNAIWSVIRGWLDPVVAAKVHFVKNTEELEKFVERERIPRELEGAEEWGWEFAEPVAGEDVRMADTPAKEKLLTARASIVRDYETTLLSWIHAKDTQDAEPSMTQRREARNKVAEELRKNYWELDPFVRARSVYDRTGVIRDRGALEFYPASGVKEKETVASATADDDVD